jgi:uncharacterized membrane protein
MDLLLAGLILFGGTHLFLSLASARTATARVTLGEPALKGIVAVLSLAGLTLIVIGWRSAEPAWIYAPPLQLRSFALLLIAMSIYLFVIANRPTFLKRVLRHPQLTGVILWAGAHLLLNGDSRSLLLFSGLGIWALLEIVLINRRDGVWQKPPAPPLVTDLVSAVIAIIAIIALAWAHPWFAGVSVIGGL